MVLRCSGGGGGRGRGQLGQLASPPLVSPPRPALRPPQDNATWAELWRMNLCDANYELVALHGCSYHCAFSAFGDDAVVGEECWLSQQPDGAPGSQCPTFPKPPRADAQSAAVRLAHTAVLLPLLALVAAVLA